MNKVLNRLEVQCQSDLHDDFTRNLFAEAAVEIERLRKDAERWREFCRQTEAGEFPAAILHGARMMGAEVLEMYIDDAPRE